MKKFNKILSIMLAVIMLFTAVARVNAEDEGHNYTPLDGTKVADNGIITINKYLVVTGEVDFPAARFDYQVTYPEANANSKYGAYIDATATNPVVYPGPKTLKVSTTTSTTEVDNRNTLTFTKGETESGTGTDFTIENGTSMFSGNTKGSATDVVIEPDQKYIIKNVVLHFPSDVKFTEPGVYRYWLQEIPAQSNPSYIANDAQVEDEEVSTWRTIDVYIVDDTENNNGELNKKLKFDGVVIYEGKLEDTAAPNKDVTFAFDVTQNEVGRSTSIIDDTWTTSSTAVTYEEIGSSPVYEISESEYEALDINDKTNYDRVERTTVTVYTWDTVTNHQWNYTTTVSKTGGTPEQDSTSTGVVGANRIPDEAVSNSNPNETYKVVHDAENQAQYEAKKEELPENTAEAGEKNVAYVNEIEFHKLTVKKTVKGNQGSTDKYFKFTIEVENAGPGTILQLDRSKHDHEDATIVVNLATNKDYTQEMIRKDNTRDDNEDTTDGFNVCTGGFDAKNHVWADTDYVYTWENYNGSDTWVGRDTNDNVETVANPSDEAKATDLNLTYKKSTELPETVSGKATIVVYLQDDEELTISGLPRGAKYTVTEEDANADGYTTDVLIDNTNLDETVENKTVKGESGVTYQQDNNGKYYLKKDGSLTTTAPVATNALKYRYDATNDEYIEDQTGEYYKDVAGRYQKVDGPTEGDYENVLRYSKEIKVEYENERSGVIPTGVFVAAGTGFAILGVGIVGMLALSRRKEEDEEE